MIRFIQSPAEYKQLRDLLDAFYVQHREEDAHDHPYQAFVHYLALIERFAPEGGRIMEIGSGNAVAANALASRGYTTLAVDYYSDEKAQALAHAYQQPRLTLRGGGFLSVPVDEASFDVICSRRTFEHCMELEEILDRITRMIKPGGVLVLTGPNYDSPYWPYLGLRKMLTSGEPNHYACYESVSSLVLGFVQGIRNITGGGIRGAYHPFRYFWPRMKNGELDFNYADDDAVCWVSSINLRNYLRETGFEILVYNEARSTGFIKTLYRALPHLAAYYRLVARKPGR